MNPPKKVEQNICTLNTFISYWVIFLQRRLNIFICFPTLSSFFITFGEFCVISMILVPWSPLLNLIPSFWQTPETKKLHHKQVQLSYRMSKIRRPVLCFNDLLILKKILKQILKLGNYDRKISEEIQKNNSVVWLKDGEQEKRTENKPKMLSGLLVVDQS